MFDLHIQMFTSVLREPKEAQGSQRELQKTPNKSNNAKRDLWLSQYRNILPKQEFFNDETMLALHIIILIRDRQAQQTLFGNM